MIKKFLTSHDESFAIMEHKNFQVSFASVAYDWNRKKNAQIHYVCSFFSFAFAIETIE